MIWVYVMFAGFAIGLVSFVRVVVGLWQWIDTDAKAKAGMARRKNDWLLHHFGKEGRISWLRHHKRLVKYRKMLYQKSELQSLYENGQVGVGTLEGHARKIAAFDDVAWDRRLGFQSAIDPHYLKEPWKHGEGFVDGMFTPGPEDWLAAGFPAKAAEMATEQNARWAESPKTDIDGRPIKGTRRGGTEWGLALLMEEAAQRIRKDPSLPGPPVPADGGKQAYIVRRRKEEWSEIIVIIAIGLALLPFFLFVVPRIDADNDRGAVQQFVEAWGDGGKEAAYKFYDHRASFHDIYFETYSPTGMIVIKEDGEGVQEQDINIYGSPERLNIRRYFVTIQAVREGNPRTLTLSVSVAKDSHKVCAVWFLTDDVARSGNRDSLVRFGTSVQPTTTGISTE